MNDPRDAGFEGRVQRTVGARLLQFLQRLGKLLPLMGSEQTTLLFVGSLVGVLLAFGALAFGGLVDLVSRLTFGSPEGRFSVAPQEEILHSVLSQPWWWALLAPALGGLLVGPLVQRFAREAKGHGIPEVMEAVALRGGKIRKRVALVKVIASALTIGTGGSAGREGPVVQIGSSIASGLSRVFGFKTDRTRTIVACGAAAGIAATFNAPIAGVVFSLEIITGSFGLSAFTPVVAAAVMATVITHFVRGNVVVFEIPAELQEATALSHPLEVLPYGVLGLLAGVASVLYIRTLYATEDWFDRRQRLPAWSKAAVGGLLVGCIGFLLPRVMGQGVETILAALDGDMVELFDRFPEATGNLSPLLVTGIALLALAVFKVLATSLTIGSGGSGGVFAPSLFIGACIGGAFGLGYLEIFGVMETMVSSFERVLDWRDWFGWEPRASESLVAPSAAAFALVGMGAVVSGVTHAPVSAVLILFEMTDDYDVILPLMLASVISTAVCSHTLGDSIYTRKLRRKGVSLHEGREQSVLRSVPVKEAMRERSDLTLIPEHMPFRQMVKRVTECTGHTFAVVSKDEDLVGIVTFDDLREALTVEALGDLVIAKEIAVPPSVTLTPESNLQDAFEAFSASQLAEIPVVAPGSEKHLVGMLGRSAAMAAYQRALSPGLNES